MNYTKEELIKELRLTGMDPAQQDQLLNMFYSSLNMKLRMAVADAMSDEQLDTFMSAIEKGDDSASEWLEQHVPNVKEIIEQETTDAVEDLKKKIDAITQ